MIAAAVVCPHPPALLRELGGIEDPVADLRAACAEALRAALVEEPDTVVVVGGAVATGRWDPSVPLGLRRFGTTTARDATYLPQSLAVGRRLLEEAGWSGPLRLHAVSWDAGVDEVAAVAGEVLAAPGRAVLVVMADGSARRGEKAPGHLDERAFGYDDAVGRALEGGDAGTLTDLDAALAADLLVQGRAALAVLGAVVTRAAVESGAAARGADEAGAATRPKTRLDYRDDPYGVLYTVATWSFTP